MIDIFGIELSEENMIARKSGKLVYIKSATMLSTPASIAHGSQPTVRGGGTSTAKVTTNN
jgi:hypothetical protein